MAVSSLIDVKISGNSWLWSVFSAQLAYELWSAAQQKVSQVSVIQAHTYILES